MTRGRSSRATLVSAGFQDTARAAQLLEDPSLADAVGFSEENQREFSAQFTRVADPDSALLALCRLLEAARDATTTAGGPQPQPDQILAEALLNHRRELLQLLGASRMLADWIISHPAELHGWPHSLEEVNAESINAALMESVGADPSASIPVASSTEFDGGIDQLRAAYWRVLLTIATIDVSHPTPQDIQPTISALLAELAGAALGAALALARSSLGEEATKIIISVIAMGKTGARELNYISDVDVLYLADPAGADEAEVIAQATRVVSTAARYLNSPSHQPALWEVDPNLRPEGKDGPLVRTLESYISYYQRWAQGWEFQALLKARPVAGDLELGRRFCDEVGELVWQAAGREGFVTDAQAMRQRVESHIKPQERDWNVKLGQGGLRDVEFTVQLLQLVHGRVDPKLRVRNTQVALAALSAGGYVSRDDAQRMGECYRELRVLEHRIQLTRMRRTQLFPKQPAAQLVIARGLGLTLDELLTRWSRTRKQVRDLHESIFYRPLLPATARLSPDDVALSPQRAQDRLTAMGYRDPAGAVRHIEALTRGLSRRATIQRHLLPVMLGWFAAGPDPDAGLLNFRTLSDSLGSTHWYLKLLRDSPAAAERLARILSHSKYLSEQLPRLPEAVMWLDQDRELTPRHTQQLGTYVESAIERHEDAFEAALSLRFLRRREYTRAAIRDVVHAVPVDTGPSILSPTLETVLGGILQLSRRAARSELRLRHDPAEFIIVAMGRLGGGEITYASDADVMFVYRAIDDSDPGVAENWATVVAQRLKQLSSTPGSEPSVDIDAALRPEGNSGPLVRSLDSYQEYYQNWALGWERQALLRARVIAGETGLGSDFEALINPIRYAAGGIAPKEVAEIRRLKARMEAERLPRGASVNTHIKLGRGGLADVEWSVQLLQLRHAHAYPDLQTTGTLTVLGRAAGHGLVDATDAEQLADAWSLATRIRNASVLWTASLRATKVDVLPRAAHDLDGVASLLNAGEGHRGQDLEEGWARASRRARQVMDRIFFDT